MKVWLAEQLPAAKTAAVDVPYLVLDIEMTGLDAQQHQMISIGWVEVAANKVLLSSARHFLIQAQTDVGQSATIHQIRDVDLEQGISEKEALSQLLVASAGKVLVFHHAYLDRQFLNVALKNYFAVPLAAPIVDTLQLEKQHLMRSNNLIEQGALRLGACRQRYGLPAYHAHNALVDAVATAELLLAIIARKKNSHLKDLLS